MTYHAPMADLDFLLRHLGGLAQARAARPDDLPDAESVRALLEAAGSFATARLAPLNAVGDRQGAVWQDGAVRMPEGFATAYADFIAGGWTGALVPQAAGGSGLPAALGAALGEIWSGANMAFSMTPVVTEASATLLARYGSAELQAAWLAGLVSGATAATMALSEPHAGSDLSVLRCRAIPMTDGSHRLHGQKIWTSFGEHDLTPNIIHLVLARLPDAPPGTKGISLFLVPKLLPNGQRNDLRCVGIEHKLGLRASPTCVMAFGDQGQGATGWLLGAPHQGLAVMFTLMNQVRLTCGVQGVGIAEAALQQARAYAASRIQGRGPDGMPVVIDRHPDVMRMLRHMAAKTWGARALVMATAAAIDQAEATQAPADAARAALLTPLAKAIAGGTGFDVASLNIQVHGGTGFVEETGAAQLLRDSRIISIFEGTNGIQAIDLATRKVLRDGGAMAQAEIARYRQAARAIGGINALAPLPASLERGIAALEQATQWLLAPGRAGPDVLAVASDYLELFGLVAAAGYLAEAAAAAAAEGETLPPDFIQAVRFYGGHMLPAAAGMAQIVCEGADQVLLD